MLRQTFDHKPHISHPSTPQDTAPMAFPPPTGPHLSTEAWLPSKYKGPFKEREKKASKESSTQAKRGYKRQSSKGSSTHSYCTSAISSTLVNILPFPRVLLHHLPRPFAQPHSKTNPSFVIDLAPADDILFDGHLLPLHLLSHPAISVGPSDISIENRSLPLDHIDMEQRANHSYRTNPNETKERRKPKSFSSFFFGKWIKGGDEGVKEEDKKKRKKGFDVTQILRKYLSAVEPFFLSLKGEKGRRDLRRRPYSFSVSSHSREKKVWKKRRGEFSAPASMRTSPTNSGVLVATSTTFSSSNESTVEELQNAIHAAIAHCKNSMAMKEELKR